MSEEKKDFGKTRLLGFVVSTDFKEKFVYLKGENRKVVEGHVRKLVTSFESFGTARAIVTVIKTKSVNGKITYYVADGQHTIIACERLGLSFNIALVELIEDSLLNVTKYIATLNNNSKAWSNDNYLTAFAKNGIREYKIVVEVMKTSGLTITDMLYIFLGGSSTKENKMFKNGELKFIDERDSMKLLDAILKVKTYVPNKAFVRRSLYKVMARAKDYDRLADAIITASKALEVAHSKFSENESDFYNHLIKIYQSEFKINK
jgi:hypothetical protein